MNVLIVYATYSGSTMTAVQVLQNLLQEKQHQVTVKTVPEVQPQDISSPDLVIMSSPSWDYHGEQGMPHEDYQDFFKIMEGQSFAQKPFAVMGLGDSNYTYFCGAVKHLEEWIASVQGVLKISSLKLDQYFFNEDARNSEIAEWAAQL